MLLRTSRAGGRCTGRILPAGSRTSPPQLSGSRRLLRRFRILPPYPVELVKRKIQVPQPESGVGRAPLKPVSVIRGILQHQGILGFWHGQMGTLIREAGGSAACSGRNIQQANYFGAIMRKRPQRPRSSRGSAPNLSRSGNRQSREHPPACRTTSYSSRRHCEVSNADRPDRTSRPEQVFVQETVAVAASWNSGLPRLRHHGSPLGAQLCLYFMVLTARRSTYHCIERRAWSILKWMTDMHYEVSA